MRAGDGERCKTWLSDIGGGNRDSERLRGDYVIMRRRRMKKEDMWMW